MRKIIVGIIIILAGIAACNTTEAQNVKREGKTFIAESSRGSSSTKDVATTYTWKDSKGKEYPIFLHQYSRGEKVGQWTTYVMRVSAKTGKEYKYYIPKGDEIAEQIRKESNLGNE